VKGCPYKKTFFNPVTRVSEKCIGCYPAVENGYQTQCTVSCIGKIRLQGFITTPDKAREDNPLDYLVHVAKIAKPLYPQFGLKTSITSRPRTASLPVANVRHGVPEAIALPARQGRREAPGRLSFARHRTPPSLSRRDRNRLRRSG
jgi:hypothetical protein